MAKLNSQGVITIDYSEDGWPEFRKWVDGTYASLKLSWVDEGPVYSVVAVDGPVARICSFNKADAEDFETHYLEVVASEPPHSTDGKPLVLPNIFPQETIVNFTGSSDNTQNGERFHGDLFAVTKTGSGTAEKECVFIDGVYLAGGSLSWTGGSPGSYAYLELDCPATTTKAPAVSGHGNCNKVATGLGFNIIVPAAGDGEFDLDVPIPVPATETEADVPNGYWSYSDPWCGLGTVSASVPGHGRYNLFDTPLDLAHFARISLLLPSGSRDLIATAIKPKWILPQWRISVEVYSADANGTLHLTWDLLIARRKSV